MDTHLVFSALISRPTVFKGVKLGFSTQRKTQVLEKRVPKRIFEHERDTVRGRC
jgi:hypothetical protein